MDVVLCGCAGDDFHLYAAVEEVGVHVMFFFDGAYDGVGLSSGDGFGGVGGCVVLLWVGVRGVGGWVVVLLWVGVGFDELHHE